MRNNAMLLLVLLLLVFQGYSQKSVSNRNFKKENIAVLGYYNGGAKEIDQYDLNKLTHVIYSFTFLKEGKLIEGPDGPKIIRKLVAQKKKVPALKVILSLGGWGGCEPCSEVFSTAKGREIFAQSTLNMLKKYGADGIDLDWEYPAIKGFEGHRFVPEDREHFTELVKILRKKLGSKYEISFAAGGFTEFLVKSVEWEKITPLLDRINMMTYDLVNGNSTVTGHATPLYSTAQQLESTDNAIRFLDSIGVPRNKVVLGAAFYTRGWEVPDTVNNGLYRPAVFKHFIPYAKQLKEFNEQAGYKLYWDEVAKAPYAFNPEKKTYLSFDDKRSIELKTKYTIDKKLNGIMFWDLSYDLPRGGLLDVIDRVKKAK